MPWTPDDAPKHTSAADTPHKRRVWANVANEALHACLNDGGQHDECEARAIRIANAAVANLSEDKNFCELCVGIKGFNEAKGVVWGYANTTVIDRGDPPDLITAEAWPGAIADFLQRPLFLFMHQPINAGEILELKITNRGLWIKAQVTYKPAWEKIRSGEIKGFSIGWLPLPDGYEFKKVDEKLVRVVHKLFLFEISLVDRPMNQESLIEGVEQKMIKEEQISINRETGEIFVSGLTSDQMAEFMSLLEMLLGKVHKQLPLPNTIVFKREQEQSLLERLKNFLPKQEDSMDQKQIEERFQALDSKLKSLEDLIAQLPTKAAIEKVIADAIGSASPDQSAQPTPPAPPASPEPETHPKPENGNEENERIESIVKLLSKLGLNEQDIATALGKEQPHDDQKDIKELLGGLHKRLDVLESAVSELSPGSVTRRIRATQGKPNAYSGLPGANLLDR